MYIYVGGMRNRYKHICYYHYMIFGIDILQNKNYFSNWNFFFFCRNVKINFILKEKNVRETEMGEKEIEERVGLRIISSICVYIFDLLFYIILC